MNPGKLTHTLFIERRRVTKDDLNADIISYRKVATIRASVITLTSGEQVRARTLGTASTHRIVTRYQSLEPTDRLTGDDIVYDIVGIVPDDRKRWMTIDARTHA